MQALQATSPLLGLCTTLDHPLPHGTALIPRGSTAVTTTWLGSETSPISEGSPAWVQPSGAPKLVGGLIEISRQWMIQATNGEQTIARELRNSITAAVLKALLQGTGSSGQPAGVGQGSDARGVATGW